MTKQLSIIMPFRNEGNEPIETLKSLCSSLSPAELEQIEIIAVDDCSTDIVDGGKRFDLFPQVRYVQRRKSFGVDICRHVGATLAKSENLFIIDAHMRFLPDHWFQKIITNLQHYPTSIFCATCLVLTEQSREIADDPSQMNKGRAAKVIFFDKRKENDPRLLSPIWLADVDIKRLNPNNESIFDVPCILGANYFLTKKWYNRIGGFDGLFVWGASEEFISIKNFLAGGSCKIDTSIQVGHIFRPQSPNPFSIQNILRNHLFIAYTAFPEDLINAMLLFSKNIPHSELEMDLVKKHKEHYKNVFTTPYSEVLQKIGIQPDIKRDVLEILFQRTVLVLEHYFPEELNQYLEQCKGYDLHLIREELDSFLKSLSFATPHRRDIIQEIFRLDLERLKAMDNYRKELQDNFDATILLQKKLQLAPNIFPIRTTIDWLNAFENDNLSDNFDELVQKKEELSVLLAQYGTKFIEQSLSEQETLLIELFANQENLTVEKVVEQYVEAFEVDSELERQRIEQFAIERIKLLFKKGILIIKN